MIDDFLSPGRRKPKVIEPLEKPALPPLPSFDDEPETPESSDNSSNFQPAPDDETTSDFEAPAIADAADPELESINDANGPKPKKKFRFLPSWPLSKRQKIIGSVLAVLLAFGIGALWTHFHQPKPAVAVTVKKQVVKKAVPPPPIYSTLSGLQVSDASINQRPVTAIMIENSLDARPQSGLDKAGIVFEALAEGGVTRFMALFQDTQPDYIGPVRSARPYYIQWALGYDAGYAHVGGSPDGLADIKAWSVRDLDQFYNSGAYHRISSRYAPHNVYTSIASLNQIEQNKGYTSSNFTGFNRKADDPYKAPAAPAAGSTTPATPSDTRTPASSIDMIFSGPYYNSHFDYDAASNSYKRSESGAAHMEVDGNGQQTQITPKVVIGMVVPENQGALDATGAYYSDYNPIGSGTAYIFQDGVVTTGTWSKATNTSPIVLTDANNQPIALNRGQTWISAVTSASNVIYK